MRNVKEFRNFFLKQPKDHKFGQDWMGISSVPHSIQLGSSNSGKMGWRFQESFTHILSALVEMAGRLGSLDMGAPMWHLYHSSFPIVEVLTRFLQGLLQHVAGGATWISKLSLRGHRIIFTILWLKAVTSIPRFNERGS